MPRVLLAALFLPLAACSQTMEQRMARAAEQINAAKPLHVESARAEGRKLIIRMENPTSSLTNEEAARVATAGLCGLDEVRALVKEGASIRMEVGGDFGGASVDVDHCPDA